MNNELLDDFSYQEEEKDIVYAGFKKRVLAFFIDVAICFLSMMSFTFIIEVLRQVLKIKDFGNLAIAAVLIIPLLYFPLFEGSKYQATLGKLIMKIKVVDINGERVSFGQAWGRFLAKIISYQIFFAGFIIIAFTKKKQGLHDIIAKTYVINNNK